MATRAQKEGSKIITSWKIRAQSEFLPQASFRGKGKISISREEGNAIKKENYEQMWDQ